MTNRKNYQAIYQILTDGSWLDYVRQGVPHPDDCMSDVRLLERRTGKRFRASVEDWSDEGREPTVYYGDWDKSLLSPAAQRNGIFKTVIY